MDMAEQVSIMSHRWNPAGQDAPTGARRAVSSPAQPNTPGRRPALSVPRRAT
jgi:hypothetical protein